MTSTICDSNRDSCRAQKIKLKIGDIMPIQESSATALVRFTGLGIICFNQDPQRGEIAALRDEHHTLNFRIQRPAFQDGADSDLITYQDIATYENLPRDGVQLEIKATNPSLAGYELYQSGGFDRLSPADLNDFQWVVNLHTLHSSNNLVPAAKQDVPLAKIYVENGLFYACKLDQDLFFEKSETDTNGVVSQPEPFGNVAETVGVKIEGDEVLVTVRIGDQEDKYSLPRIPGLPYRVEITNIDRSAKSVYSDLPDYYRYVVSANNKQFVLTPVVEEDVSTGDSISQRDFCHPIVLDAPSSIDML
jgi:hypothetical protein